MTFRFAYRRYRLPFRAAVRTAHGIWREREGLLIRLEDATGAIGCGEAAPIPWFGTETVEEIEEVCRELGAHVDAERLERVPMEFGCLRNALATALTAIAGPADRSSAAGPEPREGAGSASGDNTANHRDGNAKSQARPDYLPVAALLPAGRAALEVLKPKSEAGFRVFKWKVGVADLADELALLDDICAELPEGAKLRLDANGAWERKQAERWLERCAERPIEFVEQPCFAKASEGASRQRRTEDVLRGLAQDYPTPIALDESLVGEGDVARWLESGWPGVFVVKPSLLANPKSALDRLCAAQASVVFSSALETAVGARAALRRAFDWRGERRALGFGVSPLFADSRFDGPAAAPFFWREDIERIDPGAIWDMLGAATDTP